MSDIELNQSEVQDLAQPQGGQVMTPGALLAVRRNELGLTVDRVAEQLKMTPRQILAIENDNDSTVNSKSVYRGFVRAYAKVLKMDAAPLIALIADNAADAPSLPSAKIGVSTPFSETRFPASGRRGHQSKSMMIAIVVVALVIGILLVQKMGWIPSISEAMFTHSEKPAETAPATDTATANISDPAAVPTEGGSNDKLVQTELPPVDVASQLAPVSANATVPEDAAVVQQPVVDDAGQTAPTAGSNTSNALVLKLREDSWVEIRRANGSILISRLVSAGATEAFELTEPLQLILGNGLGVDASLRGVQLQMTPEAGSKVVKLSVK